MCQRHWKSSALHSKSEANCDQSIEIIAVDQSGCLGERTQILMLFEVTLFHMTLE